MEQSSPVVFRTAALTCGALVAFAANSLLCRLALDENTIDAASFSALRLLSGAVMLFVLVRLQRTGEPFKIGGRWTSAAALFLYAVPFSFAYNSLTAATGALILFGSVQVTMILAALWSGERPHILEWLGLAGAAGGLVYLVSGGLKTPSLVGAALMSTAGIAWGIYTLLGRGAKQPLAETEGNFIRSVPLALAVAAAGMLFQQVLSTRGVLLAVASGAITSGLGYAVWYAALNGLTATRAATVQLSVPVITAVGGVLLLGEEISAELVISAGLILGGIGLAIAGRAYFPARSEEKR